MAEVSAQSIAEKLDKSDLTDDEKAALTGILISALNGANEVEGFLLGATAGTGGVAVSPVPGLSLPSSLSGATVLQKVGEVQSFAVGAAANPGGAIAGVLGILSGATVSGLGTTNFTITA